MGGLAVHGEEYGSELDTEFAVSPWKYTSDVSFSALPKPRRLSGWVHKALRGTVPGDCLPSPPREGQKDEKSDMHPRGPEHLRSTASVGTLARRQCGYRWAGRWETQTRVTQQPGNARLWEPKGATTTQLERKDGWVQANALEGRQQTKEETETGREPDPEGPWVARLQTQEASVGGQRGGK